MNKEGSYKSNLALPVKKLTLNGTIDHRQSFQIGEFFPRYAE